MEKPNVGDKIYLEFNISWAGKSDEYTVKSVGRKNLEVDSVRIDNKCSINWVDGVISLPSYGVVGYVYHDKREFEKDELMKKIKNSLYRNSRLFENLSFDQLLEVCAILKVDCLSEFPELKNFQAE